MALFDPVMMRGPRRHLGGVGDDQHLGVLRQPRQPLADGACHRPADAAVDFVEDHRPGIAGLGQRDLQRQDEARQFAAAGDADQRPERRAGVGRHFELDAVAALGTRLGFGQRGPEASGVELQRRQFPRHLGIQALGRLAALLPQQTGGRVVGAPGRSQRRFQRGNALAAGFDRLQPGPHLLAQRRQRVGLDPVLTGQSSDVE